MVIEFLADPNVAYLIVVATGLLIFLAIITPGTGLLEVGALFGLIFTAYAVYNLSVNLWALLILILGVPPFLWGVRKSPNHALVYLAVAIFLFEVGSAYFFPSETWWLPAVHPLFALVVVAFTGGFLWIATRKALEAWRTPPRQDLTRLIQQIGEAKTDIMADGTVQVAGELWSARSATPIPAGAVVKVIGREGFVLLVDKQ
jgi:membrane-bound serine protease (ClpP class)